MTKIIWAGRWQGAVTHFAAWTEWIVHKYHQTLALFGKALDLKGCCTFGDAEGAPNADRWHSHAGRWRGWAWGGPPKQVGYAANSPLPQSQGLSTTTFASRHLHDSSVQGRDFTLFSPKDPGKEVPRTVAAWKQERGNAHTGSWNIRQKWHLCSHALAKASHRSASDSSGRGKWNPIVIGWEEGMKSNTHVEFWRLPLSGRWSRDGRDMMPSSALKGLGFLHNSPQFCYEQKATKFKLEMMHYF